MALKSQSGFTLIEMILVIGIITIIMAIGVPIYLSLSNSSQLDAATDILAQDMYIAQTNSRSQKDDNSWGVNVAGQTITLFSGNNYAGRDNSRDIVYNIPTSVAISPGQIIYSKLYGLPQSTAAFNLQNKDRTRSLQVNSKGMVEY